jgi:threonylcarbamoyladenosine tRNA methylthiotransferase MtaB
LTEIIEEIQAIESQGGKEIVLTGINLMARGASNTKNPDESRFPELLEAILRQTSIPRIRISSIGPEYASERFFEAARDARVLPHFHYSIQSFSDHVLGLMRRNYDQKLLDRVLRQTGALYATKAENISI